MILNTMITILISKTILRPMATALTLLLVLAACAGDTTDGDELQIVATTSIWADVVANIVEDDAEIEILIPTGTDAHDFEPTSGQIAALQEADLVVANGLGLEEGLEDVLESAAADGANVFEVAPELDPMAFTADEHDGAGEDGEGGEEEENEHEGEDPHVWFDPLRVATATRLIAERLTAIDGSIDWEARASAYADQLVETDNEVVGIVGDLDADQRKLVTNHDAFGYFADRYEFEVIGVVVPGGSTLADPSSAELAELVDEIRHEGVNTIFAETTQATRLAEAVAAEVGDDVAIVELYTESLGEPGSGAETLTGMLVANATLIAEAMTR